MRLAVLCFLAVAPFVSLWAQTEDESFAAALKQSLQRSRVLYPDSTVPGTALGEAVLARIIWLRQNDPGFFGDPNWPMKVASTAAASLGVVPNQPSLAPPPAAVPVAPVVEDVPPPSSGPRYLAQVTKNFSVYGASFRKNQQIVLESLESNGRRGTTLVEGQPVLLWLDNIKVLRELPAGGESPALVKIESAQYGFPGQAPYSVAPMVQSLVAPGNPGPRQLLVSDALLSASAAQRLNRSAKPSYTADPATGALALSVPYKVLTVTYSLNGEKKTKQAAEGQTITLD